MDDLADDFDPTLGEQETAAEDTDHFAADEQQQEEQAALVEVQEQQWADEVAEGAPPAAVPAQLSPARLKPSVRDLQSALSMPVPVTTTAFAALPAVALAGGTATLTAAASAEAPSAASVRRRSAGRKPSVAPAVPVAGRRAGQPQGYAGKYTSGGNSVVPAMKPGGGSIVLAPAAAELLYGSVQPHAQEQAQATEQPAPAADHAYSHAAQQAHYEQLQQQQAQMQQQHYPHPHDPYYQHQQQQQQYAYPQQAGYPPQQQQHAAYGSDPHAHVQAGQQYSQPAGAWDPATGYPSQHGYAPPPPANAYGYPPHDPYAAYQQQTPQHYDPHYAHYLQQQLPQAQFDQKQQHQQPDAPAAAAKGRTPSGGSVSSVRGGKSANGTAAAGRRSVAPASGPGVARPPATSNSRLAAAPISAAPVPSAKPTPLKRGQGTAAGADVSRTLSPPGSKSLGYKAHTLSEFRELNLEVKLGGLGPDLDNEERKAKEEKNARIRALAQQIRMENASKIAQQPPSKPKEAAKEPSLADKHRAFAAKVPKPRVRAAGEASGAGDEAELQPATTAIPSATTPTGSSAAAAKAGRRADKNGNAPAPAAAAAPAPVAGSDAELQAQLQRQAAQRAAVEKMKRQMGV